MTGRKHRSPSPKRFGLGAGAVLGIVAVIAAIRQAAPAWWISFVAAGGLCTVLALAAPRAIGPIQRAWGGLGWILNWINTRILLCLVFYLIVTPTSLALRLFGKDPMARRRRDAERPSYWTERSRPPLDPDNLHRQF